MRSNLKYPLYLFIAIFVAKLGYIVIESYYNYHVLVTTTQANLTKEMLDDLNENGHLISAFGLTVLLVPFFYFFVRRQDTKMIYTVLSIATFVTYIGVYNLLNVAVDKIVEANKDKRYEAFYITLFKYGLINNKFSYNSFISSKKIKNNDLSVNDRILLTNSFLLLYADQKLIEKLKQRGRVAAADLYIQKFAKDDYDMKYAAFKSSTQEIAKLWKEFNNARANLNQKLKTTPNQKEIKKSYKKLISSLKTGYKEYKKLWYKIDKETTPTKLKKIKTKLAKYFRYQNYSRAQREYKRTMQEKFGHYIEPSRWKNEYGNLTTAQIKRVITEEIMKKAKAKKLKNIPRGLSQKGFAYNLDVKIEVAKELRKQGIKIPYDFDYSFKQFKKYYNIAYTKKLNQAPAQFYAKLKQKVGKNDLRLDMDWHDFVHSKYIRNKVASKVQTDDPKDIDNILKAIESKDLGNFKKKIYLPKIIKQVVESYEYKKEDFLDGHKAAKSGDEAIKALYIPPFALAVSILALLLNIVTVVVMILEATGKFSKISVFMVKVLLIVAIFIIPFVTEYEGLKNKAVEKISNEDMKKYLNFLNWLSFYESINYKIHHR